jgi:N-methylhydantoinase A/oxoprolinase/acetone carboxylase beta subunit
MAPEIRAFAPSLGPLIATLARQSWANLLADPPELARIAIQAREVAGATHLVCPIDTAALAAGCAQGATLLGDELDVSSATFQDLDAIEPESVLASPWLAPMLELARIVGTQARVPLAARLPSPRRLAAQVGGVTGTEPMNPDNLLAATDICAATALSLLRAGAGLLLIDPIGGAPGDDSVALLARVAEPFQVPAIDTSGPAVATVDLPLAGDVQMGNRLGDVVLITTRPIRGDDDLGRLRELAMSLAATPAQAAGPTATAATVRGGPRARAGGALATGERFSVGIDMGGTFTDAFVTSNERAAATKVPTIRFDLTRSLVASLRSAAEAMDMETATFMRRIAILKVATTIGTNAVIEGTGSRVGLVVGRGHETNLYGPPGRADPLFAHFVAREDVVAIDPDADGDEALDACRALVANGVRQVVVALPRSATTHADESRVRRVIRARYPEHYLRSVPLQLSTDVTASGEDDVRTATAVVNAYLHRDMAHLLGRAEQELRAIGLDVPVLVVHASSGVARVATSIAVGTYSAGPSAGLSGAEHVARQLGDPVVLTVDMGGTTLDLGIVADGQCEVDVRPSVAGVLVALPTNRTTSFGIGGGSLVGLLDERITIGPESAGAVPGPAAFGRGGRRATVTDVDLVAGLLEDGATLGGEVTLSGVAALAAVEGIAAGLGLATERAAGRVEAAIDRQIGGAMGRLLADRGVDPAAATLYAFGGAGPLHAAQAATVAGIRRIRTFPYGGVFSAFGCTAVDVRHRYDFLIPTRGFERDAACAAVESLQRRAGWDLAAEGFLDRGGSCHLSLEGADGRQLAATEPVELGPAAAATLVAAAWPFPAGCTTLALIVRVAVGEAAGLPPPTTGLATPSSRLTERTIQWGDVPVRARVIRIDELQVGPSARGPLLVLDGEAVCAVPPEWAVSRQPDGSLLWERPD